MSENKTSTTTTPPAGVPPISDDAIHRAMGGPMLTPPTAASQRIDRVAPRPAVAAQPEPSVTRRPNPTFDQPDAETNKLRQSVSLARNTLGDLIQRADIAIASATRVLDTLDTPKAKKICEAENFKPADARKFIAKIETALDSVKPAKG